MKNLFIIIPCYNEEKKLLTSEIVDFVKLSNAKIIFVNDGSTDNTLEKLAGLISRSLICQSRISLLSKINQAINV